MLDYNEFKKELVKYVENTYPEQKFSQRDAIGVNRIKETLVIERENGVSPSLCFQDLYESYKETGTMEDAKNWISCAMEIENPGFDKNFLHTWEEDRASVYAMLVSRTKNYDCMVNTDIVFSEKLDFLVIYCMRVYSKDGVVGTVKIRNLFLDTWGITKDELDKQCIGNDRYTVTNMEWIHILSTEDGVHGAAGIFYSNKIEVFADKVQDDVYILPSSIHEVILLEKGSIECSAAQMKEMVKEINADMVLEEDVLSESVYLYSRETKEITIIA